LSDNALRAVPAAESRQTDAPAADNIVPLSRKAKRPSRGTIVKATIGIAGAIALGVVTWQWLGHRWTHVYVDDARIGTTLVTVSSTVSDLVTNVAVDAGDRVATDQLLVSVDASRTKLELKQIEADLAALAAEEARLHAQQDLLRKQLEARSDGASGQLAAAEADRKSSGAAFERAKADFERIRTLRDRQVATTQAFDEAQAALIQAEQQLLHAEAALRTAAANAAGVEADKAEIVVLDRQIEGLKAQSAAKEAERGQKLVDLDHREIRAAFDGVIDATFIHGGEFVTPAQRVLIYHDPRKVWIDANVKETDIRRVKVGASAAISIDAYPGRTFQGHVLTVGNAASSQFALLPSPNPSGNFTKVTQRLPIKIAVDQVDDLLRPGMMVEASIDVVD
jgi:membrane fusion protein (multidrug efflux system)